jgi:hypothetical protein
MADSVKVTSALVSLLCISCYIIWYILLFFFFKIDFAVLILKRGMFVLVLSLHHGYYGYSNDCNIEQLGWIASCPNYTRGCRVYL